MENIYLTPNEVVMIEYWRSKTHPDQFRSLFNVDLYIKLKKVRDERKIDTTRESN